MKVTAHNPLEELEDFIKRKSFLKSKERIHALILAMQGLSISEVASHLKRATSWVKRWIKRYNLSGIDGLTDKKFSGPSIKLKEELFPAFKDRILQGPLPSEKKSNFNGEDIRRILKEEFHVSYSLSGTYNLLKTLRISYTKPRGKHPKSDPMVRQQWLEKELPLFCQN